MLEGTVGQGVLQSAWEPVREQSEGDAACL